MKSSYLIRRDYEITQQIKGEEERGSFDELGIGIRE